MKSEQRNQVPLPEKLAALAQLGTVMAAVGRGSSWPGHACGLTVEEYEQLEAEVHRACVLNGWFTVDNVRHAFAAWGAALTLPALEQWVAAYPELGRSVAPKRVGLILAGNVPLVGLHDLLCVWLSGHSARVKCSSQEPGLIPALIAVLDRFVPGTQHWLVVATERLGEVDAVIATGSNNSARYFEHYFGHLPTIIRRNRVSVAVLDGSETPEEITALGEDVFRYFGLGCRNVSKVFLPEGFDLDRIFTAFLPYAWVVDHNKYGNNYDYTRALWLLDQVPFLDNGFVLLKEDHSMASPVGTLFWERYSDPAVLQARLADEASNLQCIVGHGHLGFGQAQQPGLADYADGVDTLRFLAELPQGQYS
jgi:hypothetical protein